MHSWGIKILKAFTMQIDRGTSLLPDELWDYTISTSKAVLGAVRLRKKPLTIPAGSCKKSTSVTSNSFRLYCALTAKPISLSTRI
jgi:hypothetical protein